MWVPWLRFQRQNLYAKKDFAVLCRKGHEGLYEDFADPIPFTSKSVITHVDCQHAWVKGERLKRSDYAGMCTPSRGAITPLDLEYSWNDNYPPHPIEQSTFRQYGNGKKDGQLVAIHARASDKQPGRNWATHKWVQLAKSLDKNVASIGSPKDALHIPGTEDMLGVSLGELTNILSACSFVVGPSSGPLALAMHCGTTTLWWSANLKDVTRFLSYWNPFKAQTLRVAGSWNPSLEKVQDACAKFS